ncbi:unnamed protein product [Rotaria sp. Silwood1]|nr:unnamed protein product [Rotaria sp. Silwood1]
MIWNYEFDRNDHQSMEYFSNKIKIYNNIVLLLLENDSLLESLSFKDNNINFLMWFSFQQNKLKLNHNLKRLIIKLFYFNSLFILMKNLIVLEYLNVTISTVRGGGMDDYTMDSK